MTANQRKISKQKGVELCADLLFSGKATREIVRTLTESYGVSRSAIEKWIKAARPLAKLRLQESESIKAAEMEASAKITAQKLNLTRDRILEEYAKIAYFDIRKLFNPNGSFKKIHELDDQTAAALSGIESFDETSPVTGKMLGTLRKVKTSEKRAALDGICRILGYNAPTKIAPTDSKGDDLDLSKLPVIFR